MTRVTEGSSGLLRVGCCKPFDLRFHRFQHDQGGREHQVWAIAPDECCSHQPQRISVVHGSGTTRNTLSCSGSVAVLAKKSPLAVCRGLRHRNAASTRHVELGRREHSERSRRIFTGPLRRSLHSVAAADH